MTCTVFCSLSRYITRWWCQLTTDYLWGQARPSSSTSTPCPCLVELCQPVVCILLNVDFCQTECANISCKSCTVFSCDTWDWLQLHSWHSLWRRCLAPRSTPFSEGLQGVKLALTTESKIFWSIFMLQPTHYQIWRQGQSINFSCHPEPPLKNFATPVITPCCL